jgi:hypothetical protein
VIIHTLAELQKGTTPSAFNKSWNRVLGILQNFKKSFFGEGVRNGKLAKALLSADSKNLKMRRLPPDRITLKIEQPWPAIRASARLHSGIGRSIVVRRLEDPVWEHLMSILLVVFQFLIRLYISPL